jgi:hypothetical protein
MNIQAIIQVASAVGSLLPVAGTFVQAVESAMPAGTPGAAKLETVRVGMASVYNASGEVAVAFETVWPHLQAVIASLVAIYNSMGIFHKDAPAPQ